MSFARPHNKPISRIQHSIGVGEVGKRYSPDPNSLRKLSRSPLVSLDANLSESHSISRFHSIPWTQAEVWGTWDLKRGQGRKKDIEELPTYQTPA